MKSKTAKLRQEELLGRGLFKKEIDQDRAESNEQNEIVSVERTMVGAGREVVQITWSNGLKRVRSPKPTGAVISVRNGPRRRPVTATTRRRARPSGHAPREAHNGHRRGSRRGERATSSSWDDPEPEPPGARPCACRCGRPRRQELAPPHRYYATDECRKVHNRARQRTRRTRDKADPERVAERSAARQRAEKHLEASGSGPCPGPKVAVGRCGATLVSEDPEGGVWCVLCGTPRGPLTSPNGFDATAGEMMQLDKLTVRRPATREWKTRPNRSDAARLRKTRNEYVDESIVREVVA